jgi:hypothetical protein
MMDPAIISSLFRRCNDTISRLIYANLMETLVDRRGRALLGATRHAPVRTPGILDGCHPVSRVQVCATLGVA